ncbi:putative membrane-bound dehydrogenase domain-containing protein [Fodinibius roseus]|uniref:Putative membrane-bound dehydrogenase domain-containing protein n=1 Tax=Fodinibius roseus TaxID=1194090 RepID=A0A1M5DQX5_9BACT|nr:PVC-type heme-binding CxxCH protein [Fodinibius roseus]SHF69284.1 putative membrane-bound dehydrogenase domain-containing protein [Fodinibius roseus]
MGIRTKTGWINVFTPLLAGMMLISCHERPSAPEPWPWTPQVEEFAEVYWEHGGQRLVDWMGEDTTLSPEASLEQFNVIEGLQMDHVASEPVVQQPIDLHFDARGRLWVVQYLQYPFPAGATINFYDQYLRAGYDRELSPPPGHVRGADKITLLEDTNGDGTYDSHRDVITGLDITTSVLYAYGGLWVMSPPHLLFYPDEDADGLPEGEPEVRLEGFGLEDTHSVANALTFGPDGWIYGVQGSTSTAEVAGQSWLGQVVWRYHPKTDRFELFSEGGGNSWALDFDSQGRAFMGTNAGNTRGLHVVQGGRYRKGWAKHGPLTTPYAFGYFDHMDHEGYSERFAMTFLIYEENRLGGYHGQHISGMALTNRVQASRFLQDGSTLRTVDTDSLVTTPDRGFRPVDMKAGPDGAVYIADWCDIRMNHVQPVDTWNKSCGRIWRLQPDDYQPAAPFDLTEASNGELIALLSDERKWYREQARRLLGQRADRSVLPRLRELATSEKGQLALEALWTIHLIEGLDQRWALELLGHPNPYVRAWTIRLAADTRQLRGAFRNRLTELARSEPHAEVRSQLAASLRRLDPGQALPVLRELIGRPEDCGDKHIPLLLWWALEEMVSREADAVLDFLEEHPQLWEAPLFEQHLASRLARRLAWERGDSPSYSRKNPYKNWMAYAEHPRSRMPDGKGDYSEWRTNYTPAVSNRNLGRLARLLEMAPTRAARELLLEGMAAGLDQGAPVEQIPPALQQTLRELRREFPRSEALAQVAVRLGEAAELPWDQPLPARPLLSGEERLQQRLAEGKQAYETHCGSCHQSDGSGMERMAAPLRNSRWVSGNPKQLIRLVLHGLRGELQMPPMKTLSDEDLADILTYIRNRWGNGAGPISPEAIDSVRGETTGRDHPWTRQELSGVETGQ